MPNQPQKTVELARIVRLWMNPLQPPPGPSGQQNAPPAGAGSDGWAAMIELEVACRGVPDPQTGYLLNISQIDAATRSVALPIIHTRLASRPQAHPAAILCEVAAELAHHIPALSQVGWRLGPYHSIIVQTADPSRFLVSRRFEFAAAHRLNCPDLSPQANREIFGKCNNANGHGHNYGIEVVVKAGFDQASGSLVPGIHAIDRVVASIVLDRFDHKHLNLDTTEFAALNPSVEHIARVCYELLDPEIRACGGSLQHVCIWETEKTSCTYPAPAPPE